MEKSSIIYTNENELQEIDHAYIGILISYLDDFNYLKADIAKELYLMGLDFGLEPPEILKVVKYTLENRKRLYGSKKGIKRPFQNQTYNDYFLELSGMLDEMDGMALLLTGKL